MTGTRPIDIARLRLVSSGVHRPSERGPLKVVRHLTALQAQDLPGALWSIGLRTDSVTEADVRESFNRRQIVRSWPMRGTLHVTTPDDLRMILPLSRHRLDTAFATRHRELGIEKRDVAAAERAAVTALSEQPLTRKDLFFVFQAAGQSTAGQRGAHLVGALAHAGLICLGPFLGKEQAFVLLDEWTSAGRPALDREDAIGQLALRYFRSHGPATIADLAWWANLTLGDVRRAMEGVGDGLAKISVGSTTYYAAHETLELTGAVPGARSVHLLPGFDENLLGYTDRSAALDPALAQRIVPGNNGMFKATIAAGGRIAGTWTRPEKPSAIQVTVVPFTELGRSQRAALTTVVQRYGRFRGKKAELALSAPEDAPATR